jgi:hypothetical protein
VGAIRRPSGACRAATDPARQGRTDVIVAGAPSSAGPWKAVIGDDEDADDPPLLSADEIAALMGKS